MTPLESTYLLAGLIVSITTIVTVFSLGVRFLTKHYFNEIRAQLKPNGGSSFKDQLNRLEARQDYADSLRKETFNRIEKLDRKIDDLYEKFIDYLAKINK